MTSTRKRFGVIKFTREVPKGAVAYQYDLAGRQTRITWPDSGPDGFYAAYEYDVAGAPIAVRENGAASGPGVLALYVYDDLGRRASVTRGNGVVTTYAYDSASRLDVLAHNLSGTGSDVTLDFAHNAAGQIVSRDRGSANDAYVYPQPGMNVDAYASNGLNQVASLDGAGFTHDARGNLVSAGGVSYAYDAFNRLLSAGGMTLSYDPAGRLYETTASGTTTRFLYAGLQAIAEYNTSGTLVRRFVPGAGLDEHIVWYEGAGTSDRRWFSQDERRSVVAITDGAGAALNVNSYDEYGLPAGSNAGLLGYTGQVWLPQAGLYHYRARAYSPALGRFLQTDPVGTAGGLNLYAYVGNDPLNAVDPLGQQATTGPDIVVEPLPGIEDVRRGMESAHAALVIERGARIGLINRYRPRNRFPRRPDRPTDEEIAELLDDLVNELCASGLRPPDFLMFEGGFFLPEFPAFGGGPFYIIDRYGQQYLGPELGVGFPIGGSANAWAGWVGRDLSAPTSETLSNTLTGWAIQLSVTFPPPAPVGVQFMGGFSGTAFLAGTGAPGLSLQGSYSFQVTGPSGELWPSC